MSNLLVYRFQNKIKRDSVNATLASFLKDKDGDLTEKERVWWALSAFWLPVAMQESKNYSREEIVQYTLSAIARLQQQIAYLSLVLNLDAASVSPSPACNRENGFATISLDRQGTEHRQRQEVTAQVSAHFDNYTGTETSEADNNLGQTQETSAPASDSDNFDSIFGYQ